MPCSCLRHDTLPEIAHCPSKQPHAYSARVGRAGAIGLVQRQGLRVRKDLYVSKKHWWMAAMLAIVSTPVVTVACPYCRVATQTLVDNTLAGEGKGGATSTQPGEEAWWSFAAGIDVL